MGSADEYRAKEACRFITLRTVDWVDVFIRPVYKQMIVHSLNHFIATKGMTVYAWCLMTHHLHLLACSDSGSSLADLEKEYRAFTSVKIQEAIETEPAIRKEWILNRFKNSGHLFGLAKKFQVWETSHGPGTAINFKKPGLLLEHIEHIHQNPVRDKIVDIPAEYLYSSARDYAGIKGLVHITKLPLIEQQLAAAESMNGNFLVRYIRN
jgi:putative transposase